MRKRPLLLAVLTVVALGIAWATGLRRSPEKGPASSAAIRCPGCNLLLVSIDTLRADRLGCYGYARPTSPNLDALAARSIVFRDVLAQSPTTAPSHRTIFSGRYVFEHRNDLSSVPVMAELLAREGYRTAGFIDGGQLRPQFGLQRGFETWFDARRGVRGLTGPGGLEVLNPELIAWLERHRAGPFFAFLQTYDVHCPYAPPEPYASLFTDGLETQLEDPGRCGKHLRDEPDLELGPADLAYIGALYDGGVRYVDAKLAQVIEALARLGLDRNTVLIVTSDHGESLGERAWLGHNHVYDVQLKVPLIVYVPGGPQAVVDAPAQSLDLLPTVLALLGIEGPALPGLDLLALAFASSDPPPRVRLAESTSLRRRSVRIDDRWSLVLDEGAAVELYDLAADPAEESNLIGSQPQVARSLLAASRQLGSGSGALPEFPDDLDDEMREQLRALGYATDEPHRADAP
ncbi:MAG: sulfatase [Myxococcota bacterium]